MARAKKTKNTDEQAVVPAIKAAPHDQFRQAMAACQSNSYNSYGDMFINMYYAFGDVMPGYDQKVLVQDMINMLSDYIEEKVLTNPEKYGKSKVDKLDKILKMYKRAEAEYNNQPNVAYAGQVNWGHGMVAGQNLELQQAAPIQGHPADFIAEDVDLQAVNVFDPGPHNGQAQQANNAE